MSVVTMWDGSPSQSKLEPIGKRNFGVVGASPTTDELSEQVYLLTQFVGKRTQAYEAFATKMFHRVEELESANESVNMKLGETTQALKKVELELRGAKSELADVKGRNDILERVMNESSVANASIAAKLRVAEKEHANMRKLMKGQQAREQQAARKAQLQTELQEKQTEKAKLEEELRTIRGNIQKQKDKIAIPTAVVAGGALGLITGGFGWVLAGFAAGVAGGSAAANSPICPCVTALHAQLSSAQDRLNLVNQAIGDLEAQLNPPK